MWQNARSAAVALNLCFDLGDSPAVHPYLKDWTGRSPVTPETTNDRCSLPVTGVLGLCHTLAVWSVLGKKTLWLGSEKRCGFGEITNNYECPTVTVDWTWTAVSWI